MEPGTIMHSISRYSLWVQIVLHKAQIIWLPAVSDAPLGEPSLFLRTSRTVYQLASWNPAAMKKFARVADKNYLDGVRSQYHKNHFGWAPLV